MLLGLVAPTVNNLPVRIANVPQNEPSVFPQMNDVNNLPHSPVSPIPREESEPSHIVDEITSKILASMPLRVINLSTGSFYSTTDLFRAFKQSSERWVLLSSTSVSREDLAKRAQSAVQTYFAYAMLSHVWGEDEPLYQDIHARNIFEPPSDSPGIAKLQGLCRIAKQSGFRWCWSDTCCIDKSSSAELQESINSMFCWYRNSALTIVYLADVHVPSLDALKRSRWFTRGWTLQELLAPTAIQFYMSDWSPFLAVQGGTTQANYRRIPEFIQCLESILGIDKGYLVDFRPGLDDVREKLRWMASRQTSKVEDMAYCLLGILDLRLPILYGEQDRSFIRLQDEIMKNTDDTCIFDWVGKPSTLNSYLASHPSCFRQTTVISSSSSQLPVIGAVSNITDKLSAGVLRIIEQILDDPPLGHFIANGRMNLRSFVYQVKTIKFITTSSAHGEARYVYSLTVEGLEPLDVVTSYKLSSVDARSTARTLCIGRVWDNALRRVPVSEKKTSDDSTNELWDPWSLKNEDYIATVARRLREPFVAQLLVAHPNGQFRRVHTEERIVAQPRLSELFNIRTPRTLIVH